MTEPKDIRHKKEVGRPSLESRSTIGNRKALAKDIIFLAMTEMKKQIKGSNISELSAMIKTVLPMVIDDDKQTEEDVTFNVLISKYKRVADRVQASVEKPEAIVDETD